MLGIHEINRKDHLKESIDSFIDDNIEEVARLMGIK